MRLYSIVQSAIFCGLLTLCACSSESTDSPTTTDSGALVDSASTDTGAPIDSGTPVVDSGTPTVDSSTDAPAGDLCSMLPANSAPEITDTVDSTPYPGASATGGAIETGTYQETAHIYYQPTSTPMRKWKGTMAIDTGAGTIISNISRDGAVFQQTGSTFSTAGNKLSLKFTCPAALAGMSGVVSYTYAAGKLSIFTDADKTATVFQKK